MAPRSVFPAAAALAVCLLAGRPAGAQLQKCTICHSKPGFKAVDPDGRVRSLFVDNRILAKSVHAKKTCESCHFDVTEIPHRSRPGRIECARCHYKGNPEGAPQSDRYLKYEDSEHGRALKAGKKNAPACQACHGSHDVKHTKDPESRVSHSAVSRTCGKCHGEVFEKYARSVHGIAVLEKDSPDAPSCTDCHGEHGIMRHDASGSRVSGLRISKTCSSCHAAERIVGKYGIEVEQVETFKESFHGIAGNYGDRQVANCASCHDHHDILPTSDPRSTVNPANIPATCGKCHPGANPNYAKGKIHVNPRSPASGPVYYIAEAFKWLTITVMAGLILHIILDVARRLRKGRKRAD